MVDDEIKTCDFVVVKVVAKTEFCAVVKSCDMELLNHFCEKAERKRL